QGRKKVTIPAMNGPAESLVTFEIIVDLSVNILKKFKAKMRVIRETIRFVIPIFFKKIWEKPPILPKK
ncbi:MAG TPA: hypothetical protein VN174_02345, partial [Candidatus Methanoperedens sp.]|nr:hypothetical protein [Candidatus Methanoperedens sp.]